MRNITEYFKTSSTSPDQLKRARNVEQSNRNFDSISIDDVEKNSENVAESMPEGNSAEKKDNTSIPVIDIMENVDLTDEKLTSNEISKKNAFHFLMNNRGKSENQTDVPSPKTNSATRRKLSPINSKTRKKRKIVNSVSKQINENSCHDTLEKFELETKNESILIDLSSSCDGIIQEIPKNHRTKTRSKSWKMKIKIASDDTLVKSLENSVNNRNSGDVEIVNSENCGRVLRNRNNLKKTYCIDFDTSTEDFEDAPLAKKHSRNCTEQKPVPKPLIDPEILEAKLRFLHSETPRKITKKSLSKSDTTFDVFPKVSHVNQLSIEDILPEANLMLKTSNKIEFGNVKFQFNSFIDRTSLERNMFKNKGCVINKRNVLKNLKLSNDNFPVYKMYRLLEEKFKKDPDNLLKWTDKYKPNSSDDFIGNLQSISCLKKWLENWNKLFKKGRIVFMNSDDNDSDFVEPGDCITERLTPGVVLVGPCGSGKSSSVYAICNEFGLHVIEMNASSRRTGKQFLQEFQEATKSHQIRKNKKSMFPQKIEVVEKEGVKKMCVLLIEDIDIVFEQDDGFISAIYQVLFDSKIPIILTSSDEKSIHTQKFINEYKTIKFHQLSTKNLSVWFQILCLIEGYFVDINSIYEFLEYNKCDVRKCLLGMQFWIQTGGQINRNKNLISGLCENVRDDEDLRISDDSSNSFPLKSDQVRNNYRTHMNIVSDFEIFQNEKFYNIPTRLNLEKIWWNIPNYLNFNSENAVKILKKSKRNKNKLKIISELYDSLAISDIACKNENVNNNVSFCTKRWQCSLTDSLELNPSNYGYSSNHDFELELNNYLLEQRLNVCKLKFVEFRHETHRVFDMAKPGLTEKSELLRKNRLEDELMNAVPGSSHLDHNSVSTDYLPALRNIIRFEGIRARNYTKRRNRFYNYLQGINVDCNQKLLDFASNTLTYS